MKNWHPESVLKLILSCGKIALDFYESPGYELKSDKSIVTEADKAIEAHLTSELESQEDGTYVIGEETILSRDEQYIDHAVCKTAWIVDPIDGTAPYSHHIPTWGISIGFMEKGCLKEGAIYLPAIGEIYISSNGTTYFLDNLSSEPELSMKDLKILHFDSKKKRSMISVTQEITKYSKITTSKPVQSVCCAVFSLTQLLRGRYMAYILSPHIKLWDFSAGLVFLNNAGLHLSYKDREKIKLNVKDLCNLDMAGIKKWKINREAIFSDNEENFNHVLKLIEFQSSNK